MIFHSGDLRRLGKPAGALAAAFLLLLHTGVHRAAAGNFEAQLEEVGRLIQTDRYSTALDALRFIARQVQDLRMEKVHPLFPPPPEGWSASSPLRISREEDPWSRRLEVRKTYTPEDRKGKVSITFDFYSPVISSVSLSLNPLYVAADPQARIVEIDNENARLTYYPDVGQGELLLIVGSTTLVSVSGRGIGSEAVLERFTGELDFKAIRSFTEP